MKHFYELHNSIPALYPVNNDIEIADIRPGIEDLEIDVTIRKGDLETIYHADFTGGLQQRVQVDDDHYVEILLTPRSHYIAAGSSSHGWITVTDTNIPYSSGFTPAQWMPDITASESLTIRGRIGINLTGIDFDKAVTIMRYIRENLIEHMGTPSDAINQLSPIAQFDAARKGEGRLQCNNLVDIFVHFCAAYGIIARRINLWQGGLWSEEQVKKTGYNLQTAGGHTTAEIFDRETNAWVWMDPMYGINGATLLLRGYDENGGTEDFYGDPLSLHHLASALNDTEHSLIFGVIDTNLAKKGKFNYDIWRNYLSEQQRIVYVCPRKL